MRKMRTLHFFLSMIFISVFSLGLFFGTFHLLLGENGKTLDSSTKSSHTYQYFEQNYRQKRTSLGIVTLFKEIDDFVTYDNSEEKTSILISTFGNEEYECYGSCYCESENRRSAQKSRILAEGVSYLLAAASAVVAYEIANRYFSEKCTEEFSKSCSPGSIKSEVSNCENVVKPKETRIYFCYGNCVDNQKYGPSTSKFRPTASDQGFDCRKLKREAEMIIHDTELIQHSDKISPSQKMSYTARKKFQEKHLVRFCKENSQVEYAYEVNKYNIMKSGERSYYGGSLTRVGNMCVANHGNGLFNIRCRQIDPPPENLNAAYWEKRFWEEKQEWDDI